MPEGPSIAILRDETSIFVNQLVLRAYGNAKIPMQRLESRRVADLRSFGKQTLLLFDGFYVRVHLLMFGSYRINEQRSIVPRLGLVFPNGTLKATLDKYRRRHPPCLFAGRRAVGEGRLAVCRDGGPKACGQTGWAPHAEFKRWGDVWKARRLRRAAWQDGQSSRRHATHPAGLPDIMTTAILIQCCLNFYNGSVKLLEGNPDDIYDWRVDIMSDAWDEKLVRKKFRALADALVCDALLDQDVFAGVGNIIKNEVLYLCKVHPLSRVDALSARKANQIVAQARAYSFRFLDWKKAHVLRKHWLVHNQSRCPVHEIPLSRGYLGKRKRRSFYCELCQRRYGAQVGE